MKDMIANGKCGRHFLHWVLILGRQPPQWGLPPAPIIPPSDNSPFFLVSSLSLTLLSCFSRVFFSVIEFWISVNIMLSSNVSAKLSLIHGHISYRQCCFYELFYFCLFVYSQQTSLDQSQSLYYFVHQEMWISSQTGSTTWVAKSKYTFTKPHDWLVDISPLNWDTKWSTISSS